MSSQNVVHPLLEQARRLSATGQDAAAKETYVAVLRLDPTNFFALNELGALALASDHLSAARTAYTWAVQCHPSNQVARVNLGNLAHKTGEFAAARIQYEAALAIDSDFPEAHQGLARVLTDIGEPALAEAHWQRGFSGHAMVVPPYRGTASGIAVLLLVSARGGNIPTARLLDDRVFAVTAIYAEYFDPDAELPCHDLVFNAIGDADLCALALARADRLLSRTSAFVINPPSLVGATGRVNNAERFSALPYVVAPVIRSMIRSDVMRASDLAYPLLLRAPGFHTGQHFLRIGQPVELASALAMLPNDAVLVIQCLDARGADGLTRKYRVMVIDGVLYPLHLAISTDWKVHYFTSDMAANAAHRQEEKRFLEDMGAVLGTRALSALAAVGRCLGLDYAGIDFGLDADGRVLLFEANATMVVYPPPADPIWDYKREPTDRVLDAVRRMLLRRAGHAVADEYTG